MDSDRTQQAAPINRVIYPRSRRKTVDFLPRVKLTKQSSEENPSPSVEHQQSPSGYLTNLSGFPPVNRASAKSALEPQKQGPSFATSGSGSVSSPKNRFFPSIFGRSGIVRRKSQPVTAETSEGKSEKSGIFMQIRRRTSQKSSVSTDSMDSSGFGPSIYVTDAYYSGPNVNSSAMDSYSTALLTNGTNYYSSGPISPRIYASRPVQQNYTMTIGPGQRKINRNRHQNLLPELMTNESDNFKWVSRSQPSLAREPDSLRLNSIDEEVNSYHRSKYGPLDSPPYSAHAVLVPPRFDHSQEDSARLHNFPQPPPRHKGARISNGFPQNQSRLHNHSPGRLRTPLIVELTESDENCSERSQFHSKVVKSTGNTGTHSTNGNYLSKMMTNGDISVTENNNFPSEKDNNNSRQHMNPFTRTPNDVKSMVSELNGIVSGMEEMMTSSYMEEKGDGGSESPESLQRRLSFEEEDIVLDEEGRILAGSIKALVKRLIPRKDHCPERSYIFAFLLNSRMFMAPSDLLHQIVQHCIFEQNSAGENFKKESRARFFHGILRLCSEWSETFPYDFCSESMMEQLKELLHLCSSSDSNFQRHALVLQQNLALKLSKLERYEKALSNIKHEVTQHALCPNFDGFSGISTISESPSIVAKQLTHIELERLSMIGPEEFVQTFTKEYINGDNGFRSSVKVTRNIQHYVDWFNRLTLLVATDVCKHGKKKHRVRMIEYFIDTAKECFNIGNFNSLMAIVAGLNMGPVTRLKKTWSKVETSKLEILQHQLDPSGNFTSYRATLKAAVWRAEGAKDSRQKIVVPFFSLFVKDLLLIYQKCCQKLPNGQVNFLMFSLFARQMREFLRWKRVECPFERDSTVLQYILTNPCFAEKPLQLASFECEAPDMTLEKEQHKHLKMEFKWSK